MTILKQSDILTLNNGNKYVVVSSILYNDEEYVYLINSDDHKEVMVCKFDLNKTLIEEKNQEKLKVILMEFNKNL